MSADNSVRTDARGAMSNAGWNAFATIWNIAISFLITPLLVHQLGTAEYGLLLLVWSVTGVLAITNLGVGEATLRYVSHYLADDDLPGVRRVFGSTLTFYLVICIAISAVLVPATPFVVTLIKIPEHGLNEAGTLLRLSALLFSIGMMSNAFRSIPMALHRYDVTSKVGFGHASVRTIGFAMLAMSGFGVLYLVLWDVIVALGVLGVYVAIVRGLLPTVRWMPSLSLSGLRETMGYGIYSFMTQIFLSMYRESGKLILGSQTGPSGVAYLGTPDSVAYRIYMVVISGIETLMPRFSAIRDPEVARDLVANATSAALTISAVLFVPLAVLMPDFLRLWINPEFAREGAAVGQLLTMSFVVPAGFAPIATFYRGTGKPGFVTIVLALAGIVVLLTSVVMVPTHGAVGVGYGYLLSSVAWLAGLSIGWFRVFGTRPLRPFARAVITPLLVSVVVFTLQRYARSYFGEVNWPGLIALGGTFAGATCGLVLAIDRILGGDSVSRQTLARVLAMQRVVAFRRRIHLWQTR